MKVHLEFAASTLMLVSLCALGFCQDSYDEPADQLPSEFLPPYTTDITNQTPQLTDKESSNLLDKITDELESLTPSNSSKSAPTSEPQVVDTTSPEPSEESDVEKVDYMYRDIYDDLCIRACLEAKFKVEYMQTQPDGTEASATTFIRFPVAQKASIDGDCGGRDKPKSQLLQIQWGGEKYLLKMHFVKARSGDIDNWIVDKMEFKYDTGDITYFENAVDPGERTVQVPPKSELFESLFTKSYTCEADDSIEMMSKKGLPDKATLEIYEIQLQPFMKAEANGTFSEAEICEGDKIIKPTSNVASVAVGATLGCLILIVIIVYAVGRRMGSITDRTGYKSVE